MSGSNAVKYQYVNCVYALENNWKLVRLVMTGASMMLDWDTTSKLGVLSLHSECPSCLCHAWSQWDQSQHGQIKFNVSNVAGGDSSWG